MHVSCTHCNGVGCSCGTYDVGNTGSEGSRFRPRFGCNGSLRKEIAPCLSKGPECVNGVEARYDLATGKYLPETVFEGLENRWVRGGGECDRS
jgi:hypothetical protein